MIAIAIINIEFKRWSVNRFIELHLHQVVVFFLFLVTFDFELWSLNISSGVITIQSVNFQFNTNEK